MTKLSFTDDDVLEFTDELGDVLETCDLSSDNPFDNPFHDGSWRDEAVDMLQDDEWRHIEAKDHDAFLDAVDREQEKRGYDDGVPDDPHT